MNIAFDIIGIAMNCSKIERFGRASLMLAFTIRQTELAPHFHGTCLSFTKACVLLTKGGFHMRLCFGILGRVLRACKLEQGVSDAKLVGELTRTIDPECEYGASDGTAVSRLLSCDQNLSNGSARRKGQKKSTTHSEFESGYLTNRLSNVIEEAKKVSRRNVAENITKNVLPLLDEDRKGLIIPAIFDIIASDTIIDTDRRASFEKYVGEKKNSLLAQRDIVLPDLLAGLLIYTVIAVTNTDGKADAAKVDRAYVDRFKKTAESFRITEQFDIYDQADEDKKPAGEAIMAYLEKVRDKYDKIYTLINKYEALPFYSIFVCNDIERKVPVQGLYKNAYRSEYIKNVSAYELLNFSKYIIFTGTGGIGKSMMMRHLLFDAIARYQETDILPIFILLKDFEDTGRPLIDYICESVCNYGTGITRSKVNSLLKAGKCLLLFDGLDELGTKNGDRFGKLLESFIDRYSDNQFIVSSRPSRAFAPFLRFTPMFIRPFTKDQALTLIDKINFRTDDLTIKERFRKELNQRLFNSHREFAENPLLLTIMLMTYEKYEDVPSKMHNFYRKAFEALAQEHDANKGYKRPLATGLSADDFAEYLAEFCALTYCDEIFELTKADIHEYFNRLNTLKRRRDENATPANFITDLCNNLCIMYLENDKYHFTHRSFQEYFCAVCFSKQKDRDLLDIGDIFENMRSRNYADKTFPMLYDMIPAKLDEYMFIPFLQKLFKDCDAEDGYWTFLSIMYPRIEYEKGETDGYSDTAPVSYLYEFIRKRFFDEVYDFEDLPMQEAFVIESYVYIEDENEGTVLLNVNDIPVGYEDEYGYPDEVGWILEVDIDKVKARKYHYKEVVAALDDDSFCLKQEYGQARKCLQNLLDNQTPKGHSILERLI